MIFLQRHSQPDEDETPESLHQTKARRISPAGRRVSDEEGSGDLDLNATPLGFDLNAPVEEEELLQSNSDWGSVHHDVESKPDIAEAVRINPLPIEATSLDQPKTESVPLVGDDRVQVVIKSEEVYKPRQPIPDEGNWLSALSDKILLVFFNSVSDFYMLPCTELYNATENVV